MRSALARFDGVSDIQTNIAKRQCTFKLSNPDLDLTAQLDELAKTNKHVAGWSLMN